VAAATTGEASSAVMTPVPAGGTTPTAFTLADGGTQEATPEVIEDNSEETPPPLDAGGSASGDTQAPDYHDPDEVINIGDYMRNPAANGW